jgi:transposase
MQNTTERKDVYSRITAQIVEYLEKGVRPWTRPWNAEHAAGWITRPLRLNGQPYSGINVLSLWMSALGQNFAAPICRHLRGRVIVVLDNSSTHKGAPLEQLLRQHSRLHIEHFPSYAPELNPDEGVWSLAKRALANNCPNDVEELVEDVIGSINAIRTSTRKLRGCILQSGLPSFLRCLVGGICG